MATIDELKKARLEKLEALKKRGIDPYPATVKREQTIAQARSMDGKSISIAGRIMGLRGHGNIVFGDLRDESGKMQAVFKSDEIDSKIFELLEFVDIGDFLAVQGDVGKTQAGEISVFVKDFQLISKSLRPLPDQWYGLKDVEERYRKRYLDFLLNPQVKVTLDARWRIEQAIRTFLWGEGYVEVETPVFQPLYGGTNARPFTTHMNALDYDFYLRVAPELYLKRLMVGGYERVFEIARNFRNEGIDLTHQPEFTMMEFYEAYADYHRIMDLTEELIKHAAQSANQSYIINVQDHSVDLSGKWRRITIDEAMEQYEHITWDKESDDDIRRLLAKYTIAIPGSWSRNKALFALYDHLVTPKLVDPTWVIDYPKEVSPLSKEHRSKQGRVERFEGYVGGKEVCDGWSEIVSSLEQRKRFEQEQKNFKAGDVEAHPLDEDFLTALEFGCPPLGGIGIGIDRLVMLLTNTWSIKEVVAFPTLRPELVSKQSHSKGSMRNSEYQITSDVTEKFPGISYAYTIVKDVKIHKSNPELEKLKGVLVESKRNISIEEIQNIVPIKAYRQMFKDTGVDYHSRRPSPEALLRRISQGKSLYNINTAVDAYNLAVVETGIGLGGFDYDKISPPVTLRLSKSGEIIHLLGDDSPTQTEEGELVYSDAEKLLTLDLNYRDVEETKITDKTKNIILFADGGPGIDLQEIKRALQAGVEYIQRFCGGEIREIILVK